MDKQQSHSTFSKKQKGFLYILAFLFLVLFFAEILGAISLTANSIIAITIAILLLLLDKIPNYIQSIKVGDFELEFKQIDQQQEFIFDLQQRITLLEEQFNKKKDTDRLTNRFEKAARKFNDGNLSDRKSSDREMVFTGIRLGKEFLEEKLKSKFMGERAGAASAMGSLENPDVINPLSISLEDRSSFVRYRAAKSIRKIAKILTETQVDLALRSIEEAISREQYARVSQMMLLAAQELNKR